MTRKTWALGAPFIVAVFVAVGFTILRGGAEADDAPLVEVTMTDGLTYAPATVRIEKGATVVWRNTSSVPHTVTADPRKARKPTSVRLPAGAKPFDSGNIAAGGSYRRTFDVAGTYRYFCIPHELQGMIGTVVVEG